MPLYVDYHVHTNHSYDCKTPMVEMCRQAIARGISEIAFTDHFNNHLFDLDLGYYQADQYFADLISCRAQFPELTIRAGVEVGEPHRWGSKVQPILDRYPYDVVLGSLHWVGNNSMFSPDYFRARSPEKAFGAYFSELLTMIQHGGFDILAHIDVPKRVGFDVYGHFDISTYENAVRLIWQACLKNYVIPEINTKGMRCPIRQFHPTLDALRWYTEAGGEGVMLGSDAHQPSDLAGNFDLAALVAQQAGLTHSYRFERRQIIAAHLV